MNAAVASRFKERIGQVRLNSHDVNVISAIVQQNGLLPSPFLLAQAKTMGISSDALEIIEILLDDEFLARPRTALPAKQAAKIGIADQFYHWAVSTRNGERA